MKNCEANYELYKKIAVRFLKEAGLLHYWLEYIRIPLKRASMSDWYKRKYIDSIFGMTDFTSWLKNKYEIVFPCGSYSSDLFRYFVRKNYPNLDGIEFFKDSLCDNDELKELISEENTFNIFALREAEKKKKNKIIQEKLKLYTLKK